MRLATGVVDFVESINARAVLQLITILYARSSTGYRSIARENLGSRSNDFVPFGHG